MKKLRLENKELYEVKGGGISSSMINAISKAVSTLFSIGQAVGSAIRRTISGKYCSV